MIEHLASGHVGVQQGLGDVTSWDTYFAPDDDIHGILLAALTAAPEGTICTSSQFGFTDQDIADQFARLGATPESRFLFDKSQEAGVHERPVVQGLVKMLKPEQWAIGTSKKAGQILHTKAVVLTYPPVTVVHPDPESFMDWTMTGSFNLSASAQNQFNIVDVVVSPSRAALFRKNIEAMFDWVKTHQPNNQP
jgi:hypothetical protein